MKLITQIIICLCLLLSFTAFSTKIVSVADEGWHNPASWSGGQVPVNPDTIIISRYITFDQNLVILGPTVLIIEFGATLCGDFFLDMECGSRILNYGNLFVNTAKIRDGENHYRFFAKTLITIAGCGQAGFGKGFSNLPPNGHMEVWPPVLCKTKETYWPREINTSVNQNLPVTELIVSPNPILSGYLTIRANKEIDARLYDATGSLLITATGSELMVVPMDEFPRGLYYLVLKNNEKTIHRKVLKD